jgi:hypothetical protein
MGAAAPFPHPGVYGSHMAILITMFGGLSFIRADAHSCWAPNLTYQAGTCGLLAWQDVTVVEVDLMADVPIDAVFIADVLPRARETPVVECCKSWIILRQLC